MIVAQRAGGVFDQRQYLGLAKCRDLGERLPGVTREIHKTNPLRARR